jgi:transposase
MPSLWQVALDPDMQSGSARTNLGVQNLIGDNAYDSDKLDTELRLYGIELIAPHRSNRRNKTQDLRRMRRYRRRWKLERLFAWLQNFRRLVVRYERYAKNFLGMLHLGCCLILLRHL